MVHSCPEDKGGETLGDKEGWYSWFTRSLIGTGTRGPRGKRRKGGKILWVLDWDKRSWPISQRIQKTEQTLRAVLRLIT